MHKDDCDDISGLVGRVAGLLVVWMETLYDATAAAKLEVQLCPPSWKSASGDKAFLFSSMGKFFAT